MASGPITSWLIDGETKETVRDYFLGFKITADSDGSQRGEKKPTKTYLRNRMKKPFTKY